MRYVMRQKLFSLRDSFEITDEYEQLAFTAKSAFFSIRKSFELNDSQGQKFAEITQQLIAIKPKFIFESATGETAKLKKHFFPLFSHKFSLFCQNETIEIVGNIWAHEYQFLRNGQVIGEVSKKWFSWSDTYGVDIEYQDDVWLVMCSVIAIDCLLHDDKNSNFG